MLRIADGDRAAFALLTRRHAARMTGVAVRIVGNVSDAEEVVQEGFLRVWQAAGRWQPDGARFTTWFYRIIVNLCIDRRRKVPFSPLEAAGDPPDERPDGYAVRAQSERRDLVTKALAELPERQRQALVLCYYQGLSCPDAADVLGVTVSAMEALLVRGRKALKAQCVTFGLMSSEG